MSEEQENTTKTSAYYTFKPTSEEEGQRYKPLPIDSVAEVETKPSGGSKWNTAGTFESQDFDKDDVHHVISKHYVGYTINSNGHTIEITELITVDGDVSLTFSRGKKRITFDLDHIKFRFTATISGCECGGTVSFREVDFTSIDDFTIKYELDESDNNHIEARKALRAKERDLRSKFEQVVEGFLELTNE